MSNSRCSYGSKTKSALDRPMTGSQSSSGKRVAEARVGLVPGLNIRRLRIED